MWFKSQHAELAAVGPRDITRRRDDVLVPAVQTVEVTDRDYRALFGVRHAAGVPNYLHGSGMYPPPLPQSRLGMRPGGWRLGGCAAGELRAPGYEDLGFARDHNLFAHRAHRLQDAAVLLGD